MPNLRNVLMSKQIKSVYKIIKSEVAHWNMIGKKWLQKYDTEFNENFFICKCSNTKGLHLSDLPDFYQNSILSWAFLQSKMVKLDRRSIMNERLCGNNSISVRNTPLFYQQFNKSNVKTIRDIWDTDNKTFIQENIIQNTLTDKTNWRQKSNKIKSNIPAEWIEILINYDTRASVTRGIRISPDLNIYCNEKYIEPKKLKLKNVQNLLLDTTYKPKCQTKWESILNKQFEWQLIWRSSTELPCSNKEKQFQWKLVNNAIFTEHKLQLMNFSDGLCHFCKRETEDIKHLFATCRTSQSVIDSFENTINGILNSKSYPNIALESHHVILGYMHENKSLRIFVNFILHILKWEIWKIRNKIKHENQTYTVTDICGIILKKLKDATTFLAKTKISQEFETVIGLLKCME